MRLFTTEGITGTYPAMSCDLMPAWYQATALLRDEEGYTGSGERVRYGRGGVDRIR
jgi:hypothetical protein